MTMIERVARAISRKNTGSGINWPDFTDEARVAIEAMREPTDGMISARFHCLGKGGRAEYEAMIDAALEESPCHTPK